MGSNFRHFDEVVIVCLPYRLRLFFGRPGLAVEIPVKSGFHKRVCTSALLVGAPRVHSRSRVVRGAIRKTQIACAKPK